MNAGLATVLVVFGALTGAVIGSFAGVVLDGAGAGPCGAAPAANSCRRQLRWYELVPLASYALQGGRCRSCRSPIGGSALMAELVGAVVGAAVVVGLLTALG